ncbi:MAG: site-specific DNA-methyltransferase [Treponema sp.]|jgi:DNA modification methylase|nr:site-specific DNA-methyltransferase [Treponema sp.]
MKSLRNTQENLLFPETPFIDKQLLTIKEASVWATDYLQKNVTASNISYLIQYGRIRRIDQNGTTFVSVMELNDYYLSYNGSRQLNYKEKLGDDLNWELSFDQYKEAETTKHVHRLHPYKGKFIPQLVEYFLDSHTDKFKTSVYFKPGDVVLDPFSGSGTTMTQASELGMHAVGIDISAFNTLIGNCKVAHYDITKLKMEIFRITNILQEFVVKSKILEFEERLLQELYDFNNKYFPVPEYKYKLRKKEIDEDSYSQKKEKLFLPIFEKLVKEYGIVLRQKKQDTFLDKWYSKQIRKEIDFVYSEIQNIKDKNIKNILCIILSRTIRSCRSTTHADLATLLEPVTAAYYCSKHGKICKPLFSILKWWKVYSNDTVDRLLTFAKLKTDTYQLCLTGDSRTIDIFKETKRIMPEFSSVLEKKKINGIFSSPPYVGLIDYHEQHAYAYDLFGFQRNDELEIGPLFRGRGKTAINSYADGIAAVLNNCKKYFAKDYNVFLVANDKFNLYPAIAQKADMTIVNTFHRPVLNRTEKDKAAYSETIFHLKEK